MIHSLITCISLPIRLSTDNTADHPFRIPNILKLVATWNLPIVFSRTFIFISWLESPSCIHTMWRIWVCTSSEIPPFLIYTGTQFGMKLIGNIVRFCVKAVGKIITGFPIIPEQPVLWVDWVNFCFIEIFPIVLFIFSILTIDSTNVNFSYT